MTLKQRSFCVWYVNDEVNGNATEAARRAGYRGNDKTLSRIGTENVGKPLIAAEVEKLTKAALKKADVTIEKVLRDLEDQRIEALAAKQYASAVRCSELQGKYLKMFVDKIEHVQSVEDVPLEELVRLIHEIAEEKHIDLVGLLTGTATDHSAVHADKGSPTTH